MFTMYLILVPIVAIALIVINYLISTENSYTEKDGPFECGFTSYQQSRSAFSVAFILVAILFLPFDLEVTSLLPYSLALYHSNSYGLTIIILFLVLLTIGFIFEINNNALYIVKNNISVHRKANRVLNA